MYKRLLSGRLQELINLGKVQLGYPKSGRGHLRELFITKVKSQFKWGFAKVVVTRAVRSQEWSQGEIRLYKLCQSYRILVPRKLQLDPDNSNSVISNAPLFRTQNHFPWNFPSVIYCRLFRTPAISNNFSFPLRVRNRGVKL